MNAAIHRYQERLLNELEALKSAEPRHVHTTDGRVDIVETEAENADERVDAAKVERDLAIETHILESIYRIESALQRIANNTYGLCQDCGSEIPTERLDAFPAALRCLSCKMVFEDCN